MGKTEKKETKAQIIFENVKAELANIIPCIASLSVGKCAIEIQKIMDSSIKDALNKLYLDKYKQYVWGATRDIIVNIDYVNEKKKSSTRMIKIEQILSLENGSYLIEAYCYLRKTHRSFKAENIQNMYYENGEVVTINDLIQQMEEENN